MSRLDEILAQHGQRYPVFGQNAFRQGQYNFLRWKALLITRGQAVAANEVQALVACLLKFELFGNTPFEDIARLHALTWKDVLWEQQTVLGVKVSDTTLLLMAKWYEAVRQTALLHKCSYQPSMWLKVQNGALVLETYLPRQLVVSVPMQWFSAEFDFGLQHEMRKVGRQWESVIEGKLFDRAEKKRQAKYKAQREAKAKRAAITATLAPKKKPVEPLQRLIPEPPAPPPIPELPKREPLPISDFAIRELSKLPKTAKDHQFER